MEKRSHVDINKIKEIEKGDHFQYRDVVSNTFPISGHPEDGALFNKEVEQGLYKDIVIINEDSDQVRYKKV